MHLVDDDHVERLRIQRAEHAFSRKRLHGREDAVRARLVLPTAEKPVGEFVLTQDSPEACHRLPRDLLAVHDEEHPAGLELTHGEGRGIGLARARGGNEQRAALARTRDPEKILDEGALHRVGLGTHGRNGKRQAPHHLGLGRHVRPALGLVGVDHLMEGTAERMVPERPEFGLKRPCKGTRLLRDEPCVPLAVRRERRARQVRASDQEAADVARIEDVALRVKASAPLGPEEPHLDVGDARELAHGGGIRKAEIVRGQHSSRHASFAQLLKDGQKRLDAAHRHEGNTDVEARASREFVLDHGEDLDPAVGVVDDEFRPESGLLPVGLSREEGRAELRLKTGVRRHAGGKAGGNGHGLVHARILAAAAPAKTPRCACGAGPGLPKKAACRSRPRREAKPGNYVFSPIPVQSERTGRHPTRRRLKSGPDAFEKMDMMANRSSPSMMKTQEQVHRQAIRSAHEEIRVRRRSRCGDEGLVPTNLSRCDFGP